MSKVEVAVSGALAMLGMWDGSSVDQSNGLRLSFKERQAIIQPDPDLEPDVEESDLTFRHVLQLRITSPAVCAVRKQRLLVLIQRLEQRGKADPLLGCSGVLRALIRTAACS